MKKILLSQNKYALVDDEDYKWLNKWKWCVSKNDHTGRFYAVRRKKNGKQVRMHREILEVKKGEIVDHINHDTLDNRKENLRKCSNRQNLQNIEKECSSKFPGVRWAKWANKWRASIRIESKHIHLGYFSNERDAAKAYEAECRKMGEDLICKKED